MEIYICTQDTYLNIEEMYRTAQVSVLAALQKPAVVPVPDALISPLLTE